MEWEDIRDALRELAVNDPASFLGHVLELLDYIRDEKATQGMTDYYLRAAMYELGRAREDLS